MANGNITVEVSTQAAQAELERLRAENAALKRDLEYARSGLTNGRSRMREDIARLQAALDQKHAEYEDLKACAANNARNLALEAHTWSKAAESYSADAERFRWLAEHTVATGLARWVHPFQFLADAVDARRALNRPPTPVGWSDTDWLKHLEEIRQNEAAYAKGPLPERGWD